MSLPSIKTVAKEMGVNLKASNSPRVLERILVEAMRRDLPLARAFLHKKAHEAEKKKGHADWLVRPKSRLGQQLIRLHASDALRPLASKHFCHGKKLTFINCCGGRVGTRLSAAEIADLQIKMQAGPIAYSDC